MKNEKVHLLKVVLNLKKNPIGVKLINSKEAYDALEIEASKKIGPICYHSRQAMDGHLFKANLQHVSCDYGAYALGLDQAEAAILQGQSLEFCGLSETAALGKDMIESMTFMSSKFYGFLMGPLEAMDDADVVIIISDSETSMRMVQGYAYKFGNPKNLSFFGNQALCGDLISKPYNKDDINLSLLCKGARSYGRFDDLMEGVIKTINPVSNSKEKQRILKALEDPKALGIDIDVNYNYGLGLKEFDQKIINEK
jgi:uncharacterized protein (DUF169 family)